MALHKYVERVRYTSATARVRCTNAVVQVHAVHEACVDQEWNDILLQWNVDDFGGVEEIRVPASKIWNPDIILYN